jgi:hypothetical protein
MISSRNPQPPSRNGTMMPSAMPLKNAPSSGAGPIWIGPPVSAQVTSSSPEPGSKVRSPSQSWPPEDFSNVASGLPV